MRRSINTLTGRLSTPETKCTQAVAFIYGGDTFEDAAPKVSWSAGHLVHMLRDVHYEKSGGAKSPYWRNLKEKERQNRIAKQEIAKQNAAEPTAKTVEFVASNDVIVLDPGYAIKAGVAKVEEMEYDIYIPYFCVKELERLSNNNSEAANVLRHVRQDKIHKVNLRNRETLYVEPTGVFKNRSVGVVALCCELDSMGFMVHLYTNSNEVARLAEMQGVEMEIVNI